MKKTTVNYKTNYFLAFIALVVVDSVVWRSI